jgi:transposase-like protein/DNA-directed RNA polymerase subunit RPC12/RpoP
MNNGKIKSQYLCKVCKKTFKSNTKIKNKNSFFCPYCNSTLYKWKELEQLTIYKCGNDNCPKYLKKLSGLNARERKMLKTHSSQFKLRYQYRDYHFKIDELQHSKPNKPTVDLSKIHNSQNILGLILTFYVSFANSARKTALILRMVFNIKISYQTVLNYAQAAAFHCHKFNIKNKGLIDDISAGDETYIKVKGKHHYVFFFISSIMKKITSYHIDNTRSTLPATIAMLEAKRTALENQDITLVTDGNPSYSAGVHFINSFENRDKENAIKQRKVIGLKNLDQISEENRPFKQIIERLNRTYKYHIKPAYGFNNFNGAVALTTLFVTYYNFLRPHQSLKYKIPVNIEQLNSINTIQAKWIKIISMAYR